MRKGLGLAAGFALLLSAGSASAAEPSHPALGGLTRCAAETDVAARAACYDAAVAALNGAVASGELVIVQRKEAQAAQRNAFGFNLPSLSILDRAGGAEKPLESLTSEAKSARRDASGRWIIELTDGAVWRQTDDIKLSPPPRAGSRIEIRKAALGSYFMNVDDHKGVRAKRSE